MHEQCNAQRLGPLPPAFRLGREEAGGARDRAQGLRPDPLPWKHDGLVKYARASSRHAGAASHAPGATAAWLPCRQQDASGRLEAAASAQMPRAARGIAAVLCPPGAAGELEFVAMGGEDTGVYIWDVSRPGRPPSVVNKLQARAHLGAAGPQGYRAYFLGHVVPRPPALRCE